MRRIFALVVIFTVLTACFASQIPVLANDVTLHVMPVIYKPDTGTAQFEVETTGMADPVYSIEGGDGVTIDSKTGTVHVTSMAQTGVYIVYVVSEADETLSAQANIEVRETVKYIFTEDSTERWGGSLAYDEDEDIYYLSPSASNNRLRLDRMFDISSFNGGSFTVEYDVHAIQARLIRMTGGTKDSDGTTGAFWPDTPTMPEMLAWHHVRFEVDFGVGMYRYYIDDTFQMEGSIHTKESSSAMQKNVNGFIFDCGSTDARIANIVLYTGMKEKFVDVGIDGDDILFTGTPHGNIAYQIWNPKDLSTVETAFLEAYTKEDVAVDGALYVQGEDVADENGQLRISMRDCPAGKYMVYASEENGKIVEFEINVHYEQLLFYRIINATTIEMVSEQLEQLEIDRYQTASPELQYQLSVLIFENNYQTLDEIYQAINEYEPHEEYEGQTIIVGANTLYYPEKLHDILYWDFVFYGNGVEQKSAIWSLDDTYEGVVLENGRLRINGHFQEDTIRISATSGDYSATKTIHCEMLPAFDFENSSEGFTAKGDVSLTEAWVTDNGGNRYLDPQGARFDSKALYPSVMDEEFVLEFDFMVTGVSKIDLATAKRTSSGSIDAGSWWLTMKATENGVIELESYQYQNVPLGKVPTNTWVHAKFAYGFSSDNPYSQFWIDGTQVASFDYAYTKYDQWDMQLNTFITTMPIDNVMLHNGNSFQQISIVDTTIPDVLLIPETGKLGTLQLSTMVLEDGVQYETTLADYTIKEPCSFAAIQNGVLEYTDQAHGTITVLIAVGSETIEKEVVFLPAEVYISVEGDTLTLDGVPNTEYEVILYQPLDTRTMVSSFLDAYSKEDSNSYIALQTIITSDGQGNAILSLKGLTPGRYRAYANRISSNVISSLAFDYQVDILLIQDAITNIQHPDFCHIMQRYCDDVQPLLDLFKSFDAQYQINTVTLSESKMKLLPAAIAYISFLQNMDAPDLAIKYGANQNILDLAGKVTDREYLRSNLSNFSSLEAAYNELAEQTILCGIYCVVNQYDAKQFLNNLNNPYYQSASEAQKNIISAKVANHAYDSITDLNEAVNAVKLTAGTSGVTGGGNSGSSTGYNSTNRKEQSIQTPAIIEESIPYAKISLFSDVSEQHWAYNAITMVSDNGIMIGEGTLFRPDDTITRAEFVKILVKTFALENDIADIFEDVVPNDWFYQYVACAAGAGLVEGTDGYFRPNDAITREDAIVLLYRFAIHKNITFADTATASFRDTEDISEYAIEAVGKIADMGLVQGDANKNFLPKSNLLRSEAATLIYNIFVRGLV